MGRIRRAGRRVNEASYEVRFWKIEIRTNRRSPYKVVWLVAGHRFTQSFTTRALADSYRAQLITSANNGEAFDLETGLPLSLLRKRTDVSLLEHAREYLAFTWNDVAAKSRVSILETLTRVLPVVTRDLPGAPDPAVLRRTLWKNLNQGEHAGPLDEAESQALAWLERASRPVSALRDESVVCDVLDALAINLDGRRSAPEYFSRRRRVLHRSLAYAVRKKRLNSNPVSKNNLPESWTPPESPDDAIDPRCVGTPSLIAAMLVSCSYVGQTQGPRFVAFYGCMYYAMMRPSEVVALTTDGCYLPDQGWGQLTFADSSPAPGRAFTDDGKVHEHRGLKGRNKGRPNVRRPGPQVDPQSAHPAGTGRTAARAPRPVRRRTRQAPVPQRERQPDPAIHLVAGLAEGPRDLAHPCPGRDPPAA